MEELHLKKKNCNGLLHTPGKMLPLDQFWHYKSGRHKNQPYYICDACRKLKQNARAHARANHNPDLDLVPLKRYRWIFEEIVRKVGRTEAIRRLKGGPNLILSILDGRGGHKSMRRGTVRKGIKVLAEIRANNELRHRDSIHHGSYLRGRIEKVPTDRKDLYMPHGDDDTEYRRKRRREGSDSM